MLRDCFAGGGKLLIAGNGGSCADAEHIVGELMKGFVLPRTLGDEDVYKRQVYVIGVKDDNGGRVRCGVRDGRSGENSG